VTPKTARHEWSATAMLAALRRYAGHLGRTPSLKDLRRVPLGIMPSVPTLQRRFTSLRNAQRLDGCSPNGQGGADYRYPTALLIGNLKRLARELGQTPRMRDVRFAPTPHTYIVRFGSWSGALLAAGLPLRSLSVPRTHCHRGHAFTPANLYVSPPSRWMPKGYRRCKTCYALRAAKYREGR